MSWNFDHFVADMVGSELTVLYRTFNRAIEAENYAVIETKAEQDLAWAVKHEFERRWEAQGNEAVAGGVWK